MGRQCAQQSANDLHHDIQAPGLQIHFLQPDQRQGDCRVDVTAADGAECLDQDVENKANGEGIHQDGDRQISPEDLQAEDDG